MHLKYLLFFFRVLYYIRNNIIEILKIKKLIKNLSAFLYQNNSFGIISFRLSNCVIVEKK